MIQTHPSQSELLAYAESSGADMPEELVAHVAACSYCAGEVATITDTIAITAHADELSPSREFHATILFAARQHRGPLHVPDRSTARKAMVCLAILTIVSAAGAVSIRMAGFTVDADSSGATVSQASVFSLEILRQISPEEQLLAPVVMNASAQQNPWFVSQQRAADVWDAEIDAALAALEQNPAYVGAASVVNTNRERLGETLRVLYAEQSH